MAEVVIRGGMTADIPTAAEIRAVVAAETREAARGWKHLRLPTILQGTPAGGALNIGIGNGINLGPDQGYAWSVRRLVVSGLTASASAPDIVNLYLHANQQPIWQFNGNSFGYTFDRAEIVLWPGDRLDLKNVGSLAATGLIVLSGEVDEVPAEMMHKLAWS